MTKYLCIRFDVDTPVCINPGMAQLFDLSSKLDARFTFFVNMGRSISWSAYRQKKKNLIVLPVSEKKKLSAVEKLGLMGLARTTLLNPKVGSSHGKILKIAESNGHEIGLHGGRNHSLWHHTAQTWSKDRIEEEVSWGMNELKKVGIKNIRSFASPGWNSPKALTDILASNGFDYLCDEHGAEGDFVFINRSNDSLRHVVTNIVGKGGVGYFEETAVLCPSIKEARTRFDQDLNAVGNFAMTYDHPCFAGRNGLELLQAFIEIAKDHSFQLVTVSEAAEAFLNE